MRNLFFDSRSLKKVGEDVLIGLSVHIRYPEEISIGSHVYIDDFSYISVAAEIGNHVHIAPHVSIIGGKKVCFKMGHFCTIASGSRLICSSDEHLGVGFVGPTAPPEYRDRIIEGAIVMERFSSLGTNVVVLPKVTIAEGSVVGAGALVKKSTEPWGIYVGVPARRIKGRDGSKMIEAARALGYL